jgi:hypothetical protein
LTVESGCTKIDELLAWVIQKNTEKSDITASRVKKKAKKMKKTVFLMLSAIAIIFCGCTTGSGYGLLRNAGPGHAMIHTNTIPPLTVANDRGICLSISTKSSLNIDVECILEYVQGDSAFNSANEYQQGEQLNPWVRLNYSF